MSLLLTGVMIMAAAAGGDRPPEVAEFDPSRLVRLTVSVQRASDQTVLPRLPVPIELVIENRAKQSLAVPAATLAERDNPYYTLGLLYSRDGKPELEVRFPVPTFAPWKEGLLPTRPRLMELEPGQAQRIAFLLSYDWLLDEPLALVETGTLTLRARLYGVTRDPQGMWVVDRRSYVDSEPLRIDIPEPDGKDAAALALVRGMRRPWLLAHPEALETMPQREAFGAVEHLLSASTESPYALYARAAMAFMLAWGDRFDVHPGREPRPKAAARMMADVLKDPRFLLDEQGHTLLKALGAREGVQRDSTGE